MIRKITAVLLSAVLLLPLLSSSVAADSDFRDSWLALYPDACQTLRDTINSCGGCHQNGFDLTSYGDDLKTFGIAGAEGVDSDGDTRTNLQEINACTLPWDGTSVPAAAPSWGMLKGLYR